MSKTKVPCEPSSATAKQSVAWYDKINWNVKERVSIFIRTNDLDEILAGCPALSGVEYDLTKLLEAYDAKCASLEELGETIEKFKAYNRNLWESFLREQKK